MQPMPTTVVLVRHARTAWNAEGRLQGTTDIPLDDMGRRQARALADRIRDWPVTALYASPQRRAAETASILADALGLPVIADPAWREVDCGRLEGLTRDDIRARFPEYVEASARGPVDPPGGETREALTKRVSAAYARLLLRHPDQMTMVVSHGGALRALTSRVFQLPFADRRRHSPSSNTGITVLEVGDSGVLAALSNCTRHLA